MSNHDMEERILSYLLGECGDEEGLEVEKLCRKTQTGRPRKSGWGK